MISVVITYREGRDDEPLRRCVESIRRGSFSDYEIVLVPGSRLTEGEGYIEGIRRSWGDIVAFTNADCIVPPDWLFRLSALLERGYDVAAGPRLTTGDLYSYAWNVPYSVLVDMRSGLGFGWSNCAVKKALFERVPLRPLKAHQDLDFLIRAYAAGAKVAVDWSLVVEHRHPLGSLHNSMRKQLLASENYAYLLRHHNGKVARTGLGLQTAALRYLRGFFSAGRLKPRYAPLPAYCFARFWVKVAQLAGFGFGSLRDGVVDVH